MTGDDILQCFLVVWWGSPFSYESGRSGKFCAAPGAFNSPHGFHLNTANLLVDIPQ